MKNWLKETKHSEVELQFYHAPLQHRNSWLKMSHKVTEKLQQVQAATPKPDG